MWIMSHADERRLPPSINVNVPSIARVYDLLLGGKDNFASDRQVADMVLKIAPDAPEAAHANREFLGRVIAYLAGEAGIRQFLDIGSGLPTQGNVHEHAPGSRVVYVDNDPIVLVHGRALLAKDGTTTVVQADLRGTDDILEKAATEGGIDFSQPVGLLLFAILHHINDDEDPAGIVARLRDALAPGSYVAISHFHNPGQAHPEVAEQATAAEKLFNANLGTGRWRTHEEILAYFGGLDLVEPGLVPLPEWRPSAHDVATPGITYHTFVGGVGRKTATE